MTKNQELLDICNGAINGNKIKRVAFIAAANPQVVLELLDEVERLREALKVAVDGLKNQEHVQRKQAEIIRALLASAAESGEVGL
jgi:hypothetical protein